MVELSQTGYIFAVICAFVLPVAACIIVSVKNKRFLPVLLGAVCFFVFQMCIRIPIITYVLPDIPEYVLFQATNPVLYMVFMSFSAGLAEELGRYLIMRRFMKNSSFTDAVSFGLGHGGIEAILLVGLNLILLPLLAPQTFMVTSGTDFFYSGIERLFTLIVHIGLSVIVWRTASRKKFFGVILAIFLHGALNFMAVYAANAFSAFASEVIVFIFAVSMLIYIFITFKRVKKRQGDLV